MKILIVGFTESIHVARWTKQAKNKKFEIRVFSGSDSGVTHDELKKLEIKIYHTFYTRFVSKIISGSKGRERLRKVTGQSILVFGFKEITKKLFPNYQKRYLAQVIKEFRPDIIHSMEIQTAGYLVNEVKKNYYQGKFPKWIVTNWGSDIYLFGRLKEHEEKIREVLENCDYYSCECHRDVCLAKDHGLKGKLLPVLPNTGGFNIGKIAKLRSQIKTSGRKMIIVKGYQGWAGRAQVALRALERCANLLKGYTIIIYSVQPNTGMEVAMELFSRKTKIPIKIIPLFSDHLEILNYQSKARIYLGLSISDAISTSLLESMAMGSFPIQSDTSCADEWIQNNKSGIIVPPEDPEIIEKALRKALTDDKLVDEASKMNWKTIKKRLDEKTLKKQIVDFYLKTLEK